jgi:hypothetical protein
VDAEEEDNGARVRVSGLSMCSLERQTLNRIFHSKGKAF